MFIALHAPSVALLISSSLLLALALALVVLRPHGLDVAWFTGGAAALALALGLLSPRALGGVVHDTWDAAATLIALFILSDALDANGFFTWAALRLALLARGSGPRLYLLTLLLTTATATLLANDGAVLMLTPIYAQLLVKIYPDRRAQLPYLFALGFFADAMSALFVPSNLTNILIADANHLSFAWVTLWMALPTAAAFTTAGIAFAARFRADIKTPYSTNSLGEPACAIQDPWLFRAGWLTLGGLVVGYVICGEAGLPISLVAGTAALVMLGLTWASGVRGGWRMLCGAPWSVLVYAAGMFVVITAADNSGALDFLTHPLAALAQPGAGAGGAALVAAIVAGLAAAANNLPAALVSVVSLRAAPAISHLAIYAIILSVDIGPKLTPFGSLATLLWLSALKRNGITISWGRFIRENWWVTLLTLAAALGGLFAAAALAG